LDHAFFHADVAEELLIDLKTGRKQELFGVSGHSIEVYFHKINLQVIGSKKFIGAEVGFTHSTTLPALLGQADFFQHYQIKFERYREQIEIKPASNK
jgi:hypothetical protein